jgi:hypothetical protein
MRAVKLPCRRSADSGILPLLAAIDEWRAAQLNSPTRAEALRHSRRSFLALNPPASLQRKAARHDLRRPDIGRGDAFEEFERGHSSVSRTYWRQCPGR